MKDKPENNNFSQIRQLLEDYSSRYFDDELRRYALNLLKTIRRKPLMEINRGKTEIWAASIIYVICRMNYLFDKEKDKYISTDELCVFFSVKKSTIGNKATQIETIYDIPLGDWRYTKPEIAEIFEFYVTPEGFIIPSSYVTGGEIIIEREENEDLARLIELEDEIRRLKEKELQEREARREETKRKIAEEKKERRNRNQLNLFDDV
ncbi:MAG: DUF6398 domain-containing protein [Acidobacteriota bacterium]